jgi:outer membrane receptor protein involved in Fe transport
LAKKRVLATPKVIACALLGVHAFLDWPTPRKEIVAEVQKCTKSTENSMPTLPLTTAIRRQLYTASVPLLSGALAPLLFALPSTAAQAQESKPEDAALETIVVTGSRIRRVDLETASPVVTIDKIAIEKSGKLTVGDLLQEMPAISGAATNPRVNNGGGSGASTVSLRGLGSNRTLVLVNGRRFVTNGFASDVNSIPANLIERIEVLKDGASAVYGSDAIGGVVNFILRENYQGAEFTLDYGVSDRDDGARKGASFTFGHSSDRGSLMAGVNYNQFDSVSSGDRDFSKLATYFSSGAVGQVAGSSRNPNGFISLPANLAAQLGCATATLKQPVTGKTSVSDYRCYTGADAFNYQAVNLVLTPQERTNLFVIGNYKLSDSVSAYLEAFHTKTVSNFAIAPLPFDARTDAVVISKDNYYNPFGTDFGSDGTNTYRIFRSRFTTLGQRRACSPRRQIR